MEKKTKRKEEVSHERVLAELSAIYDHMPIPLLLVDEDRRVCRVNKAVAEFAQRSKKEMIDLHWGEALRCLNYFKAPEGCGLGSACKECPVQKAVLDTFEDGKSRENIEGCFPLVRKEAVEERYILISTAYFDFDTDKRVLVFIHDLSERKKAEQELRESEERYQLLSDATFEAIFLSEKGFCLGQNKTAEKMFGYTLMEALGRPGTEWIAPEHRAIVKKNMLSGYESPYEVTALRKDGSTFPCEIQGRMMNYKGEKIRITALRDITERKQAEQSLKESEARLRTLINTTPDIICFKDGQGRWLEANAAALELFSLTGVDYRGKTDTELAELIHPVYRRAFLTCAATDEKAWQAGDLSHEEEVFPTSDGTGKVFDVIKVPLFEADGTRKGLLVLGRDITERKAAERAVRESEESYRRLFENSVVGLYQSTPEGRFIKVNAAFARMLGYGSPEDLVLSITDIATQYYFHSEDRCRFQALLAAHGSVENFEFEARRKDGSPVWVSNSTRAYFDQKGRVVRYDGIVVDISERKAAEEALRLERRQLLSIFDSLDEIVYVADPKTYEILYVNKKLKDAFKKNPVGGICYREFQGFDAPCPFCTNAIILKQKYEPYRWEYHNAVLDRDYAIIDRIIQWPDGRDVRFEFALDITERKRAEKERERLQEQLIQVQKMESVGRLAGGVAHDFNNMLGVILGRTEMMLMTLKPGGKLYKGLQEIQKAATRSAELTRQLLAFARKQSIAPKILDLNDTVKETLKMLRRLIGEHIKLIWKPESPLPPVKMDPSQVDQILTNLCVNARDAISGTGEVTLETRSVVLDKSDCTAHPDARPGRYVMLGVRDTGCGMDTETLNRVFDPFFTTKEVGKGTGLGLSTVYGIAKQNKGFVRIDSEPGKGTTVEVYLPAENGIPSGKRTLKTAKLPGSQGETLLLVEDDPGVLGMGKAMLQRLGYGVIDAGSPHEALEKARSHPGEIHLLLTDVVMPRMSGKDLAEKIKEVKPGLKVLYMSGYTADVIAQHSVLDEGIRYLQKPFTLQALAVKVREVLDADEGALAAP